LAAASSRNAAACEIDLRFIDIDETQKS